MKMNYLKVIAAFITVLIMFAAFAGCKTENGSVSSNSQIASSNTKNETTKEVVKEPTVIGITLQDNASYPLKKDSEVLKVLQEKTNTKLDITIIPEADYLEKQKITMATGNFTDIMFINDAIDNVLKYAGDGLILPLDKLIDEYAPNIKRLFPYEEKIKVQYTDGQMYSLPKVYDNTMMYIGWLVRADIMSKLGITKDPETLDEFYSMLKKMKEAYPDSYPITIRDNLTSTAFMCSWGLAESGPCFSNGKFELGGTRKEDKECIQFVNKLYKEGLIDPEFPIADTTKWEDNLINSKSFLTFDYLLRCEYFEDAINKTDPNYDIKVIPLPRASDSITPNVWVPDTLLTSHNFVLNAKTKVAVEAIKLFDYLCSDEGIALTNWGIEGVTYTKEGDTKKFLPDAKTSENPKGTINLQKDYNLMMGLYSVFNVDAYVGMNLSRSSKEGFEMYQEKDYGRAITPSVSGYMTKEESDLLAQISAELLPKIQENTNKFMLGQRSLSEWDNYIKELKKYKSDKYVELYNELYQKYLEAQK